MEDLWADVHSLHYLDSFEYTLNNTPLVSLNDYKTPNGSLLRDNSFFDSLKTNQNKIYLLHITKDIEKIKRSSTLYPSAGCLIGSIYTTQLYKEADGKFKMHNLGRHIYQKEATILGKSPTPLIIEMTFDEIGMDQTVSGIDYLKLGKIHHTIYQNLKYLLTPSERMELENTVSSRIKKSLDFINLCSHINEGSASVSGREFISILNRQIPKLPILGYIYFEVIAAYSMLYSNDDHSKDLKNRGEFNNTIYKSLLLDMYKRVGFFKLSDFNLTMNDLLKKIDELSRDGLLDIDTEDFFEHIKKCVSCKVIELFLDNPHELPNWLKITWDYSEFSKILGPLVGHIIHRELRNFDRYRDFYFYFDQFKALSAWNYWNKMNIALPFNGPLQKGEIGINPAYSHATYKIYVASQDPTSKDHLIINEHLKNIEIAPRLIDLRHTSMRSKNHKREPFSPPPDEGSVFEENSTTAKNRIKNRVLS